MLRHCTKLLLPGMIEYLAFIASVEDQRAHLKGLEEILKAFSSLFSSVPEKLRKQSDSMSCMSIN